MRTQADGLGDAVSGQTTLDCTDSQDMTDQRFRDECDINNILKRHGVVTMTRQPIYGETNYDADLQACLDAIEEGERILSRLPDAIRDKYPDTATMRAAVLDGNLHKDLQEILDKQKRDAILTPPAPTPTT